MSSHPRRREPNEILPIALVASLVIDGVQHKTPRTAIKLQGQLIEDGLYIQRPRTRVLLDVVTVAFHQLVLKDSNRRQVAALVGKLLNGAGHTAHHHIGAEVGQKRIVKIIGHRL